MKTAKFSCLAGASGDMLLGALLDVLAKQGQLDDWKRLMAHPLSIEKGGRAQITEVERGGCSARKIDFYVGEIHADHLPSGASDHHHSHHHSQHHAHRHLRDIRKIFQRESERGEIPEAALRLADKIFLILAEAEAVAHQCEIEKVHFHEVGAYDSIMDILGFSVAFTLLEIGSVTSTPVFLGTGTVMTEHGKLPVPTPAVEAIQKAYPFPSLVINTDETVFGGSAGEFGECLTPTGAAILAAIVENWEKEPTKVLESELATKVCADLSPVRIQTKSGRLGLGGGTRNPERYPNVVSVLVEEVK